MFGGKLGGRGILRYEWRLDHSCQALLCAIVGNPKRFWDKLRRQNDQRTTCLATLYNISFIDSVVSILSYPEVLGGRIQAVNTCFNGSSFHPLMWTSYYFRNEGKKFEKSMWLNYAKVIGDSDISSFPSDMDLRQLIKPRHSIKGPTPGAVEPRSPSHNRIFCIHRGKDADNFIILATIFNDKRSML